MHTQTHTHHITIPYSVVFNSQLPSRPPSITLGRQRDINTATLYCSVIDWLTFELRSGVITAESCRA